MVCGESGKDRKKERQRGKREVEEKKECVGNLGMMSPEKKEKEPEIEWNGRTGWITGWCVNGMMEGGRTALAMLQLLS